MTGRVMSSRAFVLMVKVLCFVVPIGYAVQGHGVAAQTARQARPTTTPAANAAQIAAPPRAVFDQYCVTCHNQRLHTAGLTLDTMDLAHVSDKAEVWEKVVRKLRTAAMPPAGRPRPDTATYEATSAWLEGELDRAAIAHPNPGRPTIHRLNRTEYHNATRDLFGFEVESASLLPPDSGA